MRKKAFQGSEGATKTSVEETDFLLPLKRNRI